ncbi:MAG: hypothetical protein LBE13_08480, partial [Bacteroidales bacterium]|nr:hypothetical protein [Bacteroidales bacterium]
MINMVIGYSFGNIYLSINNPDLYKRLYKLFNTVYYLSEYDKRENSKGKDFINWMITVYANCKTNAYSCKQEKELIIFEHDIRGYKFTSGNTDVFVDVDCKWKIELYNDKKYITISGESGYDLFDLVKKVIRQITASEQSNGGCVKLHASSIAYENNGIVFCGPKNSGKTTNLMRLLSTGKVKYISNDLTMCTTENLLLPTLAGPYVALATLESIDKYRK